MESLGAISDRARRQGALVLWGDSHFLSIFGTYPKWEISRFDRSLPGRLLRINCDDESQCKRRYRLIWRQACEFHRSSMWDLSVKTTWKGHMMGWLPPMWWRLLPKNFPVNILEDRSTKLTHTHRFKIRMPRLSENFNAPSLKQFTKRVYKHPWEGSK